MAANPVMRKNPQDLKDEIVSKVVDMGCACPTDLASQIGNGVNADDLLPTLETLVTMGVLRHKIDPSDTRQYADRYQTVYEPVR